MQKRALAVHDISCVGKCSLTVALPILSAAGIECSALPTAVLSTHTGGFKGYTYRDLTDDMQPCIDHWQTLGLNVDAVYTGYLGSFRQLDIVKNLFDTLCADSLKLVDPVMADNGKLYTGFDTKFVSGMRSLCEKADIIIPNITEASMMLGTEYREEGADRAYIENMLRSLTALGPRKAVLTGVSFEDGQLGAAGYDADSDRFCYYFSERIVGYYHGTGDVFGSAFLCAMMLKNDLYGALKAAVDFTVGAIRRSFAAGTENRYGVDFEGALPILQRELGTI